MLNRRNGGMLIDACMSMLNVLCFCLQMASLPTDFFIVTHVISLNQSLYPLDWSTIHTIHALKIEEEEKNRIADYELSLFRSVPCK